MVRTLMMVLFVGCGTELSYIPTNLPRKMMTPRAPESVEVFMAKQPVRPFREVAYIEAEQSSLSQKEPLEELRKFAAKKGCDGVVVNNADRIDAPPLGGWPHSVRGFRASCIIWEPAPRRAGLAEIDDTKE